MNVRWFAFLFSLILLSVPAIGQEESQKTYQLDAVTVEAQAPVSPERNLEKVDITEGAKPVIATVPEMLDTTTGIDIQSRGVLTPNNSQVKIRGFDERRSLILLDGRPLNGTGVMGGQFVDWTSVATQHWQAVELGKGAFSAKYGNTLGGTIEMTPVLAKDAPTFTAKTGFKRYETFSAGASAAGTVSELGLLVSGGYQETDGNLRNSEAERSDINARLSWDWGENRQVYAAFRFSDGQYQMPVQNLAGTAGYDDGFPDSVGTYLIGPGIRFPGTDRHGDGSYYTKERYEMDLGVKADLFGLDSELKFYLNTEDRQDYIYSYQSGDKIIERECTPDRSWGWVARFEKTFESHTLGFGADGNYQGYGGTEYRYLKAGYFKRPPTDGSDEWDATRWQGVYMDDRWMISPALDLYLGLRYEDYTGDRQVDQVTGYNNGRPAGFETVIAQFDEQTLLPKLGLVYRPISDLALHTRFARATRFPDNPAFYWYYGGYRPEVDPGSEVSRKDLTYEDARQYEAGAQYTGVPGLTLSISAYYYQVDDYIRWIFGYAPSRVVYNIDQVELQGVELAVEGKLYGDFYGFANLSWQESQKEGDLLDSSNALTDELSELPELKWNLGLKYHRKDGALARLSLRWVDDRQVPYLGEPGGAPYAGSDAPDGTPVGKNVTLQTLDDFLTVDLEFKYPVWKKGWTGYLTAGVENLLDEEYEEEFGFPQPGQSFHIGAEIRF